ncbi:MAG: hypothetical protein PF795_04440 [Kiritimatiellae bacterium]|nr:hypothetical protein [Kiritimatiellia bacterium]
MRRKVGRQHLLRGIYELLEEEDRFANTPVSIQLLLAKRSWTLSELHKLISRAKKEDHIEVISGDRLQLSESGFAEAARYTRNHRLWELYLIRFADVAARHVDRDADRVEHVLGPELVRQLEAELDEVEDMPPVIESPHDLHSGVGI